MKPSTSELDGLSEIIGLIYDTVLDETIWPQTLQRICDYTGGSASRIYWRDATRRAEIVPQSGIEACAILYGLTPSEMRVLQAALDIHTVAEMASALGVSPNTIKKHLSAIFAKMGVSRRAGLIRLVMDARP